MKITYDGVRDRELNRYVFSSFPNTDKVTSEVNREIKCITHIRHLITCALQSSEFSHKTFLICVKTTTHPASKTLSHINSATRTCLYTIDEEWIYSYDISAFTKFDLEINKLSTNMLWCLLLILGVLLKSNQCWIEHEILQFTIQYISFHLKLVWYFSWVYWSVYAGREKWLFNVIFLKVGPLCDQTWWESPVFFNCKLFIICFGCQKHFG